MINNEIGTVLLSATTQVLETMFFAAVTPSECTSRLHVDALACSVLCSGAEEGTFTVAVDRTALALLSEAFYGDDDAVSTVRERELLCELTNMLTGSTLSAYAPDHYCPLSAPRLCDLDFHLKMALPGHSRSLCSAVSLELDGGLLSVCCNLKAAV